MKIETTLEKYAQVISSEMIEALKESAKQRGVSLDMEVALRLMVAMTKSNLVQDESFVQKILGKTFTEKEAVAECKRKRADNLYLFEMEKLRLYLSFEESLPRNFKEHFSLIDVKAMTKQIKAEMKTGD